MKRIILFRGLPKSKEEREFYGFVYGLPMEFADGTIYIRQKETGQQWEIEPDSLSERTGVIAINGDSVYENDVFHLGDKKYKYHVKYQDGGFIGQRLNEGYYYSLKQLEQSITIIGNSCEKPELIK